ncbi:hypothetical protein ScPMuIL_012451 [Solemya velum]
MAAKTNIFATSVCQSSNQGTKSKAVDMDLLPPSAFESKTKDPWKELAKVSDQILDLQKENQLLRQNEEKRFKECQKVSTTVQESLARPEPYIHHMSHSPQQDTRYIDELFAKQVTEINELKSQIKTLKCKHAAELADMERGVMLKEAQYTQRINTLTLSLQSKEEQYNSQIDKLSYEHQKEADELSQHISQLVVELEGSESKSMAKIKDLSEELVQAKQQLSDKSQHLEQELRLKESQVENQNKQILQLKKYIGDTDNISKPSDLWRKEKETFENKLKLAEMERESLVSSVQLLNIRLSSMNEILSLQEAELSKSQTDITDKSKNGSFLLTRWREKVFALMVQQKSSDMSSNKCSQNWKEKITDVQNQLISANNHIDMLSHSLSDKQAQIQMEQNQNLVLNEELTQAQQLAVCLDDKLLENRENADTLRHVSVSIEERFRDSLRKLNKYSAVIKTYGHRISFASSRVEMLQGLFARKEALQQMQQQEQDNSSDRENKEREDVTPLTEELERVMLERDNLANKMKADVEMWNDRLFATKCQYEDELTSLKQTVEELELALQEKTRKCSSLDERLESAEKELEECNEQLEECRTELGRQQIALENCIEEQRASVQSEFVDQLAEMERKVNDARREHTKAVVSLRQLERQTSRDKERSKEQLNILEGDYKKQVHQLQEQVRVIESERNLMMVKFFLLSSKIRKSSHNIHS